jgi:hypothetical protein
LIPTPIGSLTHAITIYRSARDVWPWLVQMGAGSRAGWYSYDFIDNGRRRSADRIVSDLQTLELGALFPAAPGATDGFHVLTFETAHYLVIGWRPKPEDAPLMTWAFVLEERPDRSSRLIVRARGGGNYPFYGLPAWIGLPLVRAAHFIMERKQLLGIAARAEAHARPVPTTRIRKTLLVCGIASSLLYALMIWTIRYDGYSLISQVPSELTAIGAPTRALWARLGSIYTALVTAFACGVWTSAGRNRALRIVGGLILAYASLGLLWPFAAMHQREVLAAGGGTLSDTMHVVLGGVTVFLMFLAIGVGATALGKPFRLYSIASILVLLAFGALTFVEAPRLQANLPTPWIGLWERINISVFLLWVVVLATVLLRTKTSQVRRITFRRGIDPTLPS